MHQSGDCYVQAPFYRHNIEHDIPLNFLLCWDRMSIFINPVVSRRLITHLADTISPEQSRHLANDFRLPVALFHLCENGLDGLRRFLPEP